MAILEYLTHSNKKASLNSLVIFINDLCLFCRVNTHAAVMNAQDHYRNSGFYSTLILYSQIVVLWNPFSGALHAQSNVPE